LRRYPKRGEHQPGHKGDDIDNYYPAYNGSPDEGLLLKCHTVQRKVCTADTAILQKPGGVRKAEV
jgi:hypothetical protein